MLADIRKLIAAHTDRALAQSVLFSAQIGAIRSAEQRARSRFAFEMGFLAGRALRELFDAVADAVAGDDDKEESQAPKAPAAP
jgi:hypothetical protein